ncbi:rhamnulokinase [Roseiconus nitratireducens]|uniref:Rhamnulokinase n=1 Tax=Roseiconus nitratireducens TaxID=2605748 RepID=A0A5M6DCP3_9BACT|nr:rhamnulokinase family protein [Roseiconus nitratireducens]KAA5545153.1 rhamnulokinase [Roseiconus nitratireducens]
MSDSPVHLAIDLGASSGRVIAGGVDAGSLVLHEVHRFGNQPVRVQDSLQWNVLGLWAEILSGLRTAAKDFQAIRSVGVDTWGVDYVLLDQNDQVAAPVRSYRDGRTEGMMDAAFERLGGPQAGRQRIFESTGLQFMPINTAYQLFSAVERGERSLEIADGFMMMGDFFHWLLSGRRSIEATNASTTQLFNPRSGDWAFDLIDDLGIDRNLFTTVTQPGTCLGDAQASVADETGLGDVAVTVPATHDTASAVIAVPADVFAPSRPNWCYISSGTWSLMGCEIDSPKVNSLCAQLNFTNEGGIGGSTRLLKNIGGLWIFQQIRKSMQRRGKQVSWDAMVDAAKQAPTFDVLVDPDAPRFVAPVDMVDAIDAFATATGQSKPGSEGVYYRAALEGLALRYRVCLEMLERLVDNRIDTIHIVGGGAQNEFLCQMTADACNRQVVAGPVEATAIGNVVVQMIGGGGFGDASLSGGAGDAILAARRLIRDSFSVKTYQPIDPARWDEPARRFVDLVE